ncbi:tetraspanin-8-like [Alosa pseudoharengus]|uniref:tetraspanin-8-like n=1 Tax=Alosa pseudoharengus TaxID=34774 RepID=UPI003F8C8BA0
MASINKCLKWIFIVFNALFALTGAGIVLLVHVSKIAAMREEVGNFWSASLFGGLMTGISVVGAYGAYKEKRWALILFSVLVSIGMVICLIGAVNIFNVRHMITRRIEDLFESDDMNKFFQLSQEQHNLECCGTRNGYQDWSSQVPESCICPESYWGTPKCQRVAVSPKKSGYSQYWHKEMYTEVYSEPCLPFFVRFLNTMMDATVGILFGLAIVALIGVTMAIIMTCKIKKQMTAMPVPTYEFSKPPAYEELYTMKSMPEHV